METQETATEARRARGPEAEVRAVLDAYAAAASRLDIEGVLALLADEIVTFDCPPPLRYEGKHALRESWQQNVVEMFQAPVEYSFEDVAIIARADLAVARSYLRFKGTTKDGKPMKAMLRCTHVLEKRDGRWLIVHDHNSVPVDYDGKGLMELEP